MKATLQLKGYCVTGEIWALRVHEDPDAALGSPYFASGIVSRDRDTGLIEAFTSQRPYSVGVWRAVRAALADKGLTKAHWTRGYGADGRPVDRFIHHS